MTTTMTLGEYLELNDHVVVFAAGVVEDVAVDGGRPGSYHYPAGCKSWVIPGQRLALEGTVDADNRWKSSGELAMHDYHGNVITKITARVAPRQ